MWQGVPKATLMERIAADAKNYQILIERYDVRDGRIQGGEAYTEGLGATATRSTLSHTYLDGALDRIVQHWASGDQRTVFAARRPMSLPQLSSDLSRRIAERTVDLLRTRESRVPLSAVELSYRSVETYVPLIIPCTEQDAISQLCLTVAIDAGRWIELPEEALAPAITDFHERLRTTEQYRRRHGDVAPGRTAGDRARSSPAADQPVPRCYAIDWEAEGIRSRRFCRSAAPPRNRCASSGRRLDLTEPSDWRGRRFRPRQRCRDRRRPATRPRVTCRASPRFPERSDSAWS